MKAKSRRRLLISSVAMLLVAMLALGTATFAWFTNNTRVTADGMNVTAAVAKGLQITGKNGAGTDDISSSNWGSSVSFNQSATLNNVSVNYTVDETLPADSYYPSKVLKTGVLADSADAANNVYTSTNFDGAWQTKSGYPAAATNSGTLAQGSDGYFAVYEVGVRATDDTISSKTISMVVTVAGDSANFVRVAVLEGEANSAAGVGGNDVKAVLGDSAGTKAISAISPLTVATSNQELTASGSTVATFTGITKTNIQWYTIVCWFEGQDENCLDANVSKTANINVAFSYTP